MAKTLDKESRALAEHGVSFDYMREVQTRLRETGLDICERPCGDLALGYTWNLRFRGTFGWVMAHSASGEGIRSEVERMEKCTGHPKRETLQVWDWIGQQWLNYELE